MTHSLIFPFLVLNVVLLFYTSFCCKWPTSCHIFAKRPVGQKLLDHADLDVHAVATHFTNP